LQPSSGYHARPWPAACPEMFRRRGQRNSPNMRTPHPPEPPRPGSTLPGHSLAAGWSLCRAVVVSEELGFGAPGEAPRDAIISIVTLGPHRHAVRRAQRIAFQAGGGHGVLARLECRAIAACIEVSGVWSLYRPAVHPPTSVDRARVRRSSVDGSSRALAGIGREFVSRFLGHAQARRQEGEAECCASSATPVPQGHSLSRVSRTIGPEYLALRARDSQSVLAQAPQFGWALAPASNHTIS
jgi:hypothetical protein